MAGTNARDGLHTDGEDRGILVQEVPGEGPGDGLFVVRMAALGLWLLVRIC